MPETSRLASTVETWWPALLVALQTGVTNGRTEADNRTIKQVKRGLLVPCESVVPDACPA